MRSRVITFVIYDRFQSLDLLGPFEVFRHAGYECVVVAAEEGPVRSSMGASINPDRSIASMEPRGIDTVIVAGGNGVFAARADRALIDWIAVAGASARRVASVCSGAFLLAEAGLLKGRSATTHWRRGQRLAQEYPAVAVDCDPIFIRDGRVWTSAGVVSGMDLALALVEDDAGAPAALAVARELVLFLRRPGSQSQFSVPLWSKQPATDAMHAAVEAIHTNPGERHSIATLASLARLSPRQFQRRFTQEIGLPPAAYVERVRIEAVKRALADGADPLEALARRYGFGSAETLRRSFHRLVGIAPSEYRSRFSSAHAPRIPVAAR